MANFRLTLSYDGTRYRGWQRQGNTDCTIQAKVEAVLGRILDQPVECHASGRTDAGVHARAQVVSFQAATALRPEAILAQLRRYLPEDIGAMALCQAPHRFHARLNAAEKTYVYRVHNSACPDVFNRRFVVQMPQRLDVETMQRAAQALVGRHDFASFCGNPHMKKSTVRTIFSFTVLRRGEEVVFTVRGDGFLMNMVRIMVGTLLEIGQGRRAADEIPAILRQRRRDCAGPMAPAQGLCLWEVEY